MTQTYIEYKRRRGIERSMNKYKNIYFFTLQRFGPSPSPHFKGRVWGGGGAVQSYKDGRLWFGY